LTGGQRRIRAAGFFFAITHNVIARRHDEAIQNKSFLKLFFWIASFLAMTKT